MNKTIIVIVLVAIIGLGAYFMFSRENSPSPMGNNESNTQQSTKSSLKAFLASGVSQRCTVKSAIENSFSEGTVYVGQGKMRGDFTSQSQGQTVRSHMIADQNYFYAWTDGMNQGFKMAINAASGEGNNSVDVNQEIEWDCDSWSVDSAMFNAPSNITFTEFNAGAAAQGSVNANLKVQQCNACNSLAEPQKSQCRQALSCSQ